MPSELFPLAQGYNCEFVQKHNINDISSVKHLTFDYRTQNLNFCQKNNVPNQHFRQKIGKTVLAPPKASQSYNANVYRGLQGD